MRTSTIETIARGVCIKDGKILLAYLKEKNHYFLPGGHVEEGESIFQTLERELMEEAGLSIIPKELVLVFEHGWKNKGMLIHEMNYILTYDIKDNLPVSSQLDHLEFVWIIVDDFKKIVFLPKEIMSAIEEIMKGNISLKFISSLKK